MHLLIRVRIRSPLHLHAFVKSLVPLSAVVHLCSLAGHQHSLLWLVHAQQVDTQPGASLRLPAMLCGLARLWLEEEKPCLGGAAATGWVCYLWHVVIWTCQSGACAERALQYLKPFPQCVTHGVSMCQASCCCSCAMGMPLAGCEQAVVAFAMLCREHPNFGKPLGLYSGEHRTSHSMLRASGKRILAAHLILQSRAGLSLFCWIAGKA